MGWSVGKPFISSSGTAYFQYTKIGCPPSASKRCEGVVDYDEAWLFASDDIAVSSSGDAPSFRTLPEGNVGLHSHNRSSQPSTPLPSSQWIAEEGDLVEMGGGSTHLYYTYRTSDGYLGVGTSTDGGHSFTGPLYAEYERVLEGESGSGRLKNPRGPITPRRLSNGRYLLLFFNRANGGIQGGRNPYWLVAGRYDPTKNTILWSQPEIALYTIYASAAANENNGTHRDKRGSAAGDGSMGWRVHVRDRDPIGTKLGYCDLFEFGGSIFMTETDKITARIHKLDPELVAGLLEQGTHSGPPAIAPLLNWSAPASSGSGSGRGSGRGSDVGSDTGSSRVVPSPFEGIDVSAGGSVTIEAWVQLPDPDPSAPPGRTAIIDCGPTAQRRLSFFVQSGSLKSSFLHTSTNKTTSIASQRLVMLSHSTNASTAAGPTPIPGPAPAAVLAPAPGGGGLHQVVLVVDGLAQIVSFLVDGIMLDGGTQLGTGFFELALLEPEGREKGQGQGQGQGQVNLATTAGAAPPGGASGLGYLRAGPQSCTIGPGIRALRAYGSRASAPAHERGYLRTSEVAASFRQGIGRAGASARNPA